MGEINLFMTAAPRNDLAVLGISLLLVEAIHHKYTLDRVNVGPLMIECDTIYYKYIQTWVGRPLIGKINLFITAAPKNCPPILGISLLLIGAIHYMYTNG